MKESFTQSVIGWTGVLSFFAVLLSTTALVANPTLPAANARAQTAPTFDPTRNYGPNPVQQALIRHLAQAHDYVILGDTSHRIAETQIFSIHPQTVAALAQGGSTHFFMEQSPAIQSHLDRTARLRPAYQGDGSNPQYVFSSWIQDSEQQNAIDKTMHASLTHHGSTVRFIAADRRFEPNGLVRQNFNWLDRAILNSTVEAAKKGTLRSHAKFEALNAVYRLKNDGQDWWDVQGTNILMNDKPVADYIASFNGAGAIRYGIGHFRGEGPNGTDLRTHLEDKGKTLVLTAVFRDANDRRTFREKSGYEPDIIFYVDPPAEHPNGVEILNRAYQNLYEHAKTNPNGNPAQTEWSNPDISPYRTQYKPIVF